MDGFANELNEGEIQFRDNLQFELKSEYPEADVEGITYTQEFYLFIPSPLQINHGTYSRDEFYLDQTNFIRFKTPKFSFAELLDIGNEHSPLFQLNYFASRSNAFSHFHVVDEMKLLGNIIRSTLRAKVAQLLGLVNHPFSHHLNKYELIDNQVNELLNSLKAIQENFNATYERLEHRTSDPSLSHDYEYVNEFIFRSIDYYLTGFLFEIGKNLQPDLDLTVEKVKKFLIALKIQYESSLHEEIRRTDPEAEKESILYREGHLNKFMLEALQLTPNRQSHSEKYTHLIGAFAAAIAMFLYMMLFVFWQGRSLVINSMPFILFAVLIYVIKDRMKEGFKLYYQKLSQRWFPDYITNVYTGDGKAMIGNLSEFFSYLDESKIPPVIDKIRNTEFHNELIHMKRHETVIFYKKSFKILPKERSVISRRHEINTIFRFNIHRFLEKASNSFETTPILDPATGRIEEKVLPKVYHLNMIIKNTVIYPSQPPHVDYLKFRVVIDKNGIKRIEQISARPE
jgi:hypothetical protein